MTKEEAELIEKPYKEKAIKGEPVYFSSKIDGYNYYLQTVISKNENNNWDVYFTIRRVDYHDREVTVNSNFLKKNFLEL